MDATQIYSQTLSQLGDTLIGMTSAEWDNRLQAANAEERQRAARLMIQTQHARLSLGNAVLQGIADQLKTNESDLTTGIDTLKGTLASLANVTQVLNTLASVLSVVGRIVSLA